MKSSVKIVWLPKKNLGLVKEVDTLVKLLGKHGEAQRILADPIKLITLILRSKLLGQQVSIFTYNISAYSWLILLIARFLNARLIQFLHEPGMANKLNYGYKHALKIFLVELLVLFNVTIAHHIVTFSDQAYGITSRKFKRKKVHKVKLLPYASVQMSNLHVGRQFPLIFIGAIHPAKNFHIFLEVAKLIHERSGHKSKIISKSKRYIMTEGIESCPYLDVTCDELINDDVIEQGLSFSTMLFKMDKNMMQSGLVAQSMYYGTACILSDIKGFQQDFHHKLHLIYPVDTDPEVIANAVLSFHQTDKYENLRERMDVCCKIHEQKLRTWDELLRGI